MPQDGRPPDWTKWLQGSVLVLLGLIVCTVAFRNPYYAGIVTITGIAAILTMSVNLSAYAGVLMFASGGLYGVGAYTYANLSLLGQSALIALLSAAAMSTVGRLCHDHCELEAAWDSILRSARSSAISS